MPRPKTTEVRRIPISLAKEVDRVKKLFGYKTDAKAFNFIETNYRLKLSKTSKKAIFDL